MEQIFIRLIALPLTVKGVTVTDKDGNYNVYINSCLNYETQNTTAEHELTHIRKQHFYDYNPVVINEMEAECG